MPQTYRDDPEPSGDDDLWERLTKLYERICSVGDQIYSAGSGVGILHKRIDSLEASVFALRRDCDEIRRLLMDRGKPKCSCGESLRVGHYTDCSNVKED